MLSKGLRSGISAEPGPSDARALHPAYLTWFPQPSNKDVDMSGDIGVDVDIYACIVLIVCLSVFDCVLIV